MNSLCGMGERAFQWVFLSIITLADKRCGTRQQGEQPVMLHTLHLLRMSLCRNFSRSESIVPAEKSGWLSNDLHARITLPQASESGPRGEVVLFPCCSYSRE